MEKAFNKCPVCGGDAYLLTERAEYLKYPLMQWKVMSKTFVFKFSCHKKTSTAQTSADFPVGELEKIVHWDVVDTPETE